MDFEASGEKDETGSNLKRGIFATYQGFGNWNLELQTGFNTGILNDTLFLERGNTYRYFTYPNAKEYPSGRIVEMMSTIYKNHNRYQFFFLGDAFIGNSSPLKFEYGDPNGMRVGLNGLISIKPEAVPDTVTFNLVLQANLNKGFPGTDNPHLPDPKSAGGFPRMDLSFPVVIK